MVEATKTVVDNYAIGRKGIPRFPEAYGRALPTKVVPVENGEPVNDHPGLDPIEVFRREIQNIIDAKAQEKDYDSGATLASYVNSTIPQWAAEASAFVAWRDAVWLHALTELDKVQSGARSQPTIEAFLAELPAFEWPE